jgi:hypothetical protein
MTEPALKRWRERCLASGKRQLIAYAGFSSTETAERCISGDIWEDHLDCLVCDDASLALRWLREEMEREDG